MAFKQFTRRIQITISENTSFNKNLHKLLLYIYFKLKIPHKTDLSGTTELINAFSSA